MKKIALLVAVLALLSLVSVQQVLAGQVVEPRAGPAQEEPAETPEAESEEAEEAEAAEEVAEETAEMAPVDVPVEIPFLEAWMNSPHNLADAEAFRHWDEDDPAVVPESCAKCHSTPGMIDYLGADGSEPLVVDQPVPTGTTVECMACHNDVAITLDSVLMPSGAVLDNLGHEAVCMECHQGRSSTVDVDEAILGLELAEEPDTINEELGFINIHYYAAAATKYGTLAKGGYQYADHAYEAAFMHVPGYATCTDCHGAHSLEIDLQECATCHEDVEEVEDLRDIRMYGSLVDYDGDGDMDEGVYYEMQSLQEMLYAAIQDYAQAVVEAPIVYDSHAYPYFFQDTNGNGEVDEGEAAYPNAYASWTPRLLKAAYNYQVSQKDPGAYAHGGKYIVQLLYDSMVDLNEALPEQIDMAMLVRNDVGHFNGAEEAFRHWDEEGVVPGSCAKCHTGEGLPAFLGEQVNTSTSPSNGLQCTTCHSDLETFELYQVEAVEFPSGAVLTSETLEDNLCMNCHQGRESGHDVEARVRNLEPDAVSEELRFINPHYFAAGATRYGSEAIGAYQYEGQEYFGYFEHVRKYDSCVECHDAHQLEVDWEDCEGCHEGVAGPEDLVNIREYTDDFDGDGDAEEGIYFEIETMQEILYAAIQRYAAEEVGTPIIYAEAYPYWFVDTDADGLVTPGEAIYPNQYSTWTPRLLKAAYNYQYVGKDPGGFTHNGQYLLQVLYDTLADMGVDVSGMVRPE